MSERTRNVLDNVQSGSFSPNTENGLSLHPATADLVSRFMGALAEKLAAAEAKYGYSDGWASPIWQEECRRQLHHHAAKGDPRDVAAYAAFCWHHGWSTASPIREPEISREAAYKLAHAFITDQSDGEWPESLIRKDADKLADAILNLAPVAESARIYLQGMEDAQPPAKSPGQRLWEGYTATGDVTIPWVAVTSAARERWERIAAAYDAGKP